MGRNMNEGRQEPPGPSTYELHPDQQAALPPLKSYAGCVGTGEDFVTQAREDIEPLFLEYGVDMYLAGHEHNYESYVVRPVQPYIICRQNSRAQVCRTACGVAFAIPLIRLPFAWVTRADSSPAVGTAAGSTFPVKRCTMNSTDCYIGKSFDEPQAPVHVVAGHGGTESADTFGDNWGPWTRKQLGTSSISRCSR